MAGVHQIFSFDPLAGVVSIVAGNGLEGLLDGPAHEAWFAQSVRPGRGRRRQHLGG